MKKHTTFKIGGNADFLVIPENTEQIAKLVKLLQNEKYIVLGNGSNVVFSDEGFKGVVIKLGNKFSDIEVSGTVITAQSGALLSKVAQTAAAHGLGGFEFAAGIPGTIGGAVCMNAGAYGGEMAQVVTKTTYVDKNGTVNECFSHNFGYRHSVYSNTDNIVLTCEIMLHKKDKAEIKNLMEELSKRRKEKQPLEYPSAGSTFKRPEGYFAGKLIEDCDLKGKSVGGAQVSRKHAGFVINTGEATCKDIEALVEHIKETVNQKFGVELETEIKFIK